MIGILSCTHAVHHFQRLDLFRQLHLASFHYLIGFFGWLLQAVYHCCPIIIPFQFHIFSPSCNRGRPSRKNTLSAMGYSIHLIGQIAQMCDYPCSQGFRCGQVVNGCKVWYRSWKGTQLHEATSKGKFHHCRDKSISA